MIHAIYRALKLVKKDNSKRPTPTTNAHVLGAGYVQKAGGWVQTRVKKHVAERSELSSFV